MEVCSCYLFVEMKCTLVRVPTYLIASSLSETGKMGNIRIPNENDVDRGSDYEVRRTGKTRHPD